MLVEKPVDSLLGKPLWCDGLHSQPVGEVCRRTDILLDGDMCVAAQGKVPGEAFEDFGERSISKARNHLGTAEDSFKHRCSLLAP